MTQTKSKVSILMGSKSDLPIMTKAANILRDFNIDYTIKVLSAHRTPHETIQYIEDNLKRFDGLPTLIMWGSEDFCFNIKFLNKWREIFPRAEVREVCNAGHLVVEDASDEIIPWIEGFLRKN